MQWCAVVHYLTTRNSNDTNELRNSSCSAGSATHILLPTRHRAKLDAKKLDWQTRRAVQTLRDFSHVHHDSLNAVASTLLFRDLRQRRRRQRRQ